MSLFEQRDRLKATNKFIYTGKYKKKEKGDCKLRVINNK